MSEWPIRGLVQRCKRKVWIPGTHGHVRCDLAIHHGGDHVAVFDVGRPVTVGWPVSAVEAANDATFRPSPRADGDGA